MKTIALMPVRNEAVCLPHSLAALSAFCDVIIVLDQNSDDTSRVACRNFAKVVLLEREGNVGDKGRWELLDAARNYDGRNLLVYCDADELIPCHPWNSFISQVGDLRAGTVIDLLNFNLWGSARRFRNDDSFYRPGWKSVGFVDDRVSDYQRHDGLSLHGQRFPPCANATVIRPSNLPILHLQWLFVEYNQIKQAWYRCQELIGTQKSAAEINRFYSVTLPLRFVRSSPIPPQWLDGLSWPDFSAELGGWQEMEILKWFDEFGVEYFEPLEIWHVERLRNEFTRRTNRSPNCDQSYRPGTFARWTGNIKRFVEAATSVAAS